MQLKANETLNEQIRIAKESESKNAEDSLQAIAQEYEEQIQSLEYDLSWAKSQKATAEDNVKELQVELDANKNLLGETRKEMESISMRNNLEKLFIITKAMTYKKEIADKELERKRIVADKESTHKSIEQDLRRKVNAHEKQSLKYEQRLKLVSSTLLNHRRDELIQHKTKSKEVAQEMKLIDSRAEIIETERSGLLDILSHLEDEMKDVERRINDHSQVSALQGSGKINLHHARKKRRLDEE